MASINNADNIVAQTGAPLNIYTELGTFTPTISGATTAGAGTYTTQAGFYHRIGNVIYVVATVIWTAHTGTGTLLLTALPFTVRNQANYVPVGTFNPINIAIPAGGSGSSMTFQLNTTRAAPFVYRANNTNVNYTLGASGTVQYSGFYLK